jgi:hypothetical protein
VVISFTTKGQTDVSIKGEYSEMFSIERMKYGEREFLFKGVNEIDTSSQFSSLINNNVEYLDYLLTHFSDNSDYEELLSISDSILLQNEFIKTLTHDSAFNKIMERFSERVNNAGNFIPDTISLRDLLNVAVKFFSITKINEEGYYVGKVCSGINGIKQTESKRNPQLEAFCFATVLNNYQSEEYNMYNEFVKGIKELYEINLGIEDSERLLRAQGAMFLIMKKNVRLKELLLYEFDRKKEFLSFVLKEE